MKIFTFAKIADKDARHEIYKEIQNGISRFGTWDQEKSLRESWYGKHSMLLKIKPDDWIVHINLPEYGKCVAVKVISEYDYDQGIQCNWGKDFNNYFKVDSSSIIEFDRNDSNVLPSVNLAPRRRIQRIHQSNDFLQSLDNLKSGKFDEIEKSERGIVHLKDKVSSILPQISHQIHEMNKSKEFERFLHRIFEKMPNTISIQNGFGWRSDNGADLIVEFENPVIGINIKSKLIVQAKSYEGHHFDKNSVDQIKQGIEKYDADAGLLITTAKETEEIENYITEVSEEIDKTIDLMAGADVARFVLRYAPELVL